jgi:hypothetical protein
MTDTVGPQTYAVLDLPDPIATKVIKTWRKHNDEFRMALPAETTVVGSGGLGCFKVGSSLTEVRETLDRIAADTPPIRTSLDHVVRFPNTDIFVFVFSDHSELRGLQERVAASGLQFEDNPWPFTPHVTLRSRSPVTDDEAAGLLKETIPGSFELEQLSVYQLAEDPSGNAPVVCTLLHRAQLSAGPSGR